MAEFLTMDEAKSKFGTKGRTNAGLTLGIIGTALAALIDGQLKYAYSDLCAPVPSIAPLYCSPFTSYGTGMYAGTAASNFNAVNTAINTVTGGCPSCTAQ